MSTLDKLIQVVAKEADKDPSSMTAASTFEDDIGLDSLAIVEVVLKIEEAFGITVPDEDVKDFKTLGDVAKYIDSKQG